MNYNAILILEAIAAAPIPDEVKLQAVKDIRRMYEDVEYGLRVNSYRDHYQLYNVPILAAHHWFAKSDLGIDFWNRMDKVLHS